MLMHRDIDEEVVGALVARETMSMGSEPYGSLEELNEQCLDLLADQAAAQPMHGNQLLRQVGEIWYSLDRPARERAASCPYLLVDVGFTDPGRWRRFHGHQVNSPPPAPYGGFFTVPQAASVAKQVFTYAWYLASTRSLAAQLRLGASAHCAHLISTCTVTQIHQLADHHPEWLRPRWATKVKVWRNMLLAAASGDGAALERARMHGFQLLANEVRSASLRSV
jgi:hypothetical protein